VTVLSRPLRAMLESALATPTSGDVARDVERLRETLVIVLGRVLDLADVGWEELVAEATTRGGWDQWRSGGLAVASDAATDPAPEVTRDLLAELAEELVARGDVRSEPWEGADRQAAVESPVWAEGRRRREVIFAIESVMVHLANGHAEAVAESADAIASRDDARSFPELPAVLRSCADELRTRPAVSAATRRRMMRALADTPFVAAAADLPVSMPPRPSAEEVIATLRLQPLPVEGGLFRQTWRREEGGAVIGTVTYAALTADADSFSAIHRLTRDEAWHFYLGDPVQMVLLHPDGTVTRPVLGQDLTEGQAPQVVVPAGTWMGAGLVAGGEYALFGNTMAPGFESSCYEGGVREKLLDEYPAAAAEIERLTRPGEPTTMPEGL
jgi:hypothetical protein